MYILECDQFLQLGKLRQSQLETFPTSQMTEVEVKEKN